MKNYKLILLAAVASCAFSACSGDHATNNGVDSVNNNYDVRSNVDTSTVTHTMGEATLVESYGSGGTTIAKDTTPMKVRSVTIAPAAAAAPAAPAKADSAAAPAATAPKK